MNKTLGFVDGSGEVVNFINYRQYKKARRNNKMNNAIFFEQLPLTLHVKDLVQILSISHNTAYKLVRSGKIRSIKIGRCYRIPRDAVAEYLIKG